MLEWILLLIICGWVWKYLLSTSRPEACVACQDEIKETEVIQFKAQNKVRDVRICNECGVGIVSIYRNITNNLKDTIKRQNQKLEDAEDDIIKQVIEKENLLDNSKYLEWKVQQQAQLLERTEKLQTQINELEEEMIREREQQLCVVCHVAKKDILFFPCNHLCVCDSCLRNMKKQWTPGSRDTKCPVCMDPVRGDLRVYE